MQVMKSCSVLEEAIVHSYEEHSQAIEEKLQENFAVLERISKSDYYFTTFYYIIKEIENASACCVQL
jgi:hypothetical protein